MRQSGGQPASHGRITKAGSAHARGMLVEAAWSASKAPGPLRAFYQRVCASRGMQIAVVAAARKLTVLCWHLIIKGEDYAYAQPSWSRISVASSSCAPGCRRTAADRARPPGTRCRLSAPPNVTSPAQAEMAYRVTIAAWQPTRPSARTAAR